MTEEHSQHNQAIIEAFNKGYKIINGEIISPYQKEPLKGYIKEKNRKGQYKQFTYKSKGKNNHISVHRLLAYQKFGEKALNTGIQTRHLNGNSLDNSWDNISIGTASDNSFDRPSGQRKQSAINASIRIRKLSDEKVKEIRELYAQGWNYPQLMAQYNIRSKGTLFSILNREYQTKNPGIQPVDDGHFPQL